ncbi:hypothetical protein HMPREF1869_00896 [Bacteroidales bacterium KA00251]|nr:hypothetical protein HMPREF1869_00896 [Bacteroidales bacterium KA00251]
MAKIGQRFELCKRNEPPLKIISYLCSGLGRSERIPKPLLRQFY